MRASMRSHVRERCVSIVVMASSSKRAAIHNNDGLGCLLVCLFTLARLCNWCLLSPAATIPLKLHRLRYALKLSRRTQLAHAAAAFIC